MDRVRWCVVMADKKLWKHFTIFDNLVEACPRRCNCYEIGKTMSHYPNVQNFTRSQSSPTPDIMYIPKGKGARVDITPWLTAPNILTTYNSEGRERLNLPIVSVVYPHIMPDNM